jgi:hypothetical protein
MKLKGGLNFDKDYMDEQIKLLDLINDEYKGESNYLKPYIENDSDFDDFIKNFEDNVYKKQLRKMMEGDASEEEIEKFQDSYLDIKPIMKKYLKDRRSFKQIKNLPSPPKGAGLTGKGKKKKRGGKSSSSSKKKKSKKKGGRKNTKKRSKTKKKRSKIKK